jgi:hypothetical protein
MALVSVGLTGCGKETKPATGGTPAATPAKEKDKDDKPK